MWGKSLTGQLLRRRRCTPHTPENFFPQIFSSRSENVGDVARHTQVLTHAGGVQRLRRRMLFISWLPH
ncbi:MAG: hypothetical protein RSC87_09055, partial [Muribaculaceae bacterium]